MNEPPTVSVLVPTRDRPEQLADCLAALTRSEFPRARLEVVVANDGARPLGDLADRFREHLDLAVVELARVGSAAARNAAAARAAGDLLAFLDDDCIPDPRWLTVLAERHARDPAAGLGGRTVNARPEDPYASAADVVIQVGYAWNNRDAARIRFLASNNLALPADAFRALRGFDERFARSADRDLLDRWLADSRRLQYVPDAVVHHSQRLGLAEFVRKHFANGRGVRRFHRQRVARGGKRVLPEPGYYALLLRTALRERPVTRGLILAGLVSLSQLANYSGYAREAVRPRA